MTYRLILRDRRGVPLAELPLESGDLRGGMQIAAAQMREHPEYVKAEIMRNLAILRTVERRTPKRPLLAGVFRDPEAPAPFQV